MATRARAVPRLAAASTVAILVHGVGDHSGRNILQSARRALDRWPGGPIEHRVASVAGLPGLEESNGPADALEVLAGDRTHIIIPTVWSRLRPRVANEAEEPGPPEPISDRLGRVTLEAPITLLPALWNGLRCVPAAGNVGKGILVLLGTFVFAGAVLLLPATIFALSMWLISWRAVADSAAYVWWRAPGMILVLAVFVWLARKPYQVVDFVGDVVAYVGSRRHRERAQSMLRALLLDVARRAPNGQLVVVAHSLGTVLASHALLDAPDLAALGPRLHLVTLGSPLRLMAWFFPAYVKTPAALAAAYEEGGRVATWVNLWRDRDGIGRELSLPSTPRFAETSLGDGPHQDYWGDARAWHATVECLDAAATGEVGRLSAGWSGRELEAEERRELVAHANRTVATALTFNLVGALGVAYFWFWCRERSWLIEVEPAARRIGLTLAVVGTALFCGYYLVSGLRVGGEGVNPREMLARYRRNWSAAATMLRGALVAGVLSTLVLWMAMR